MVGKCKLKKPMGIKIGRLKKPIVKKLIRNLMEKETFILCGFWIPKYAWKKIHLRVEISIYGF